MSAYRKRSYPRKYIKAWSPSMRGAAYIAADRAQRRYIARMKQRASGFKQTNYRRRAGNYRTGGFMGIELKFLDCAWNDVAIAQSTDGTGIEMQPSTGCTNALSVPAQGDGESQRDGRKYTIKSIWVSGQVNWTGLSGQTILTPNAGMFFCLVLDTQANGATIVSENVYSNPSTQPGAMLPQPLRNLQNSKRYRILAVQRVRTVPVMTGNDAAGTYDAAPGGTPKINLSWKGNLVCDSTGTTANVASASDNAVHLLAVTGGTSYTPVFEGKSRMRFLG